MKYNLTSMVLVVLTLIAPQCGVQSQDHSIALQQILDEACASKENTIIGVSLTVKSPELNIDFTGSGGFDNMEKTKLIDAQQPFRIASLTKVFVATAILRLQEKGAISIEEPISKYISPEHISILSEGGYNPDMITIRHCLNHTSGLYDYAVGGTEYIEEASKDPAKRWTRTEQLQFAMDHGKPHARPGREENYSDTGYILLGEILERQTDSGLAESLRELLKFDELEMTSTYLESLEERPDGLLPNVKRYMGEMDASDWDNSVDLYGGGGLVSNTHDLTTFLQALFNGNIFEKDDTLDVMLLKKSYEGKRKKLPNQRLGFTSIIGKESGTEVYLHSGFWGTIFLHIPAYNCSIALNYTYDGDSEALQRTIDFVLEQGKKKR
ncbi:serine hydrolase domain-containing protein [uncultured Croceitalea sp.]|uniref:serine hydrolase domain-containing protein n=1 Tax=uncultured Croceitalea sp. TaxID=1798908 RepID=UPI003305C24C